MVACSCTWCLRSHPSTGHVPFSKQRPIRWLLLRHRQHRPMANLLYQLPPIVNNCFPPSFTRCNSMLLLANWTFVFGFWRCKCVILPVFVLLGPPWFAWIWSKLPTIWFTGFLLSLGNHRPSLWLGPPLLATCLGQLGQLPCAGTQAFVCSTVQQLRKVVYWWLAVSWPLPSDLFLDHSSLVLLQCCVSCPQIPSN